MDPTMQRCLIQEAPPFDPSSYDNLEKEAMLLSKDWWDKWCFYTGYNCIPTKIHPGAITNFTIIMPNPNPNTFIYIPSLTWKRLCGWFGGGPKHKVLIIDGKAQLNNINISITFLSLSSKTIILPLSLKFIDFKDYVCRKFKTNQDNWKFYINLKGTNKTKLVESNYTLEELGFCNGINIICEKKKSRYKTIVPLDIRDDDDEDEDMRKVLSFSMNDAFDAGKSEICNRYYVDGSVNCIDGYLDKTCENLDDVRVIKDRVNEVMRGTRVELRLKSLKEVRRNVVEIERIMLGEL
ncbi:hypothetical protein SteCoe_27349 [Stentor coeruleus]|uniref:DUSP domain-containing protein n=1 Tax=Stentor coeruleus TaxID=5963 RepID=A0A1R2BAR3_9CILI|nr:hypothetical protein SteCoe_27349 [Stentor coeruleus]